MCRVAKLDIFGNHACILPRVSRGVLDESALIGTFLLNSSGVPFLALVCSRGESHRRNKVVYSAMIEYWGYAFPFGISRDLNLSFEATRNAWGHASQPAEVSSEVTLVGKTDSQCDL